MIERFCDEYDIKLAIHNHGPDQSPVYWRPEGVLEVCQGRSKRIGACPDTGYWIRSGIDPIEGIRKLGDRLITIQAHDLNELSADGHDVPWGTGKAQFAAADPGAASPGDQADAVRLGVLVRLRRQHGRNGRVREVLRSGHQRTAARTRTGLEQCWMDPQCAPTMHVMCSVFMVVSVVLQARSALAAETATAQHRVHLLRRHACQAISAYGEQRKLLETPNIDRIAREGMRFDRCLVTNSICGPSRATILTGKYSHLNGFYNNTNSRFDGSQPTFPKLLQAAGYKTAIIGKWHLVSDPTGFDYWHILPGQGVYYNPPMIENGEQVAARGLRHRHHHRPVARLAEEPRQVASRSC